MNVVNDAADLIPKVESYIRPIVSWCLNCSPTNLILGFYGVVFLADFCNFMIHVWNHALDGGLLSLINITDTIIAKDFKDGKIKEDFKDARNNMATVTVDLRFRRALGMRRRYYISYMNSESNQTIQMYIINLYQSIINLDQTEKKLV